MRTYDLGCAMLGGLAAIGLMSWAGEPVGLWAGALMLGAYWLGSRR